MSYKRKTVPKFHYDFLKILLVTLLLSLIPNIIHKALAVEFISPISDVEVIEIEKQVPVEVPVPIGCKTEKCEMMAYIVEKFQDNADDAITIVSQGENKGWNQGATNHNSNGTKDWGLMQVNDVNETTCYDLDFRNSWKDNIDCGYRIFQRAGDSFSPWATSHLVGVKSFWQ